MALAFHSSAAAVFNINLQPVFCFVVLFAVQCQIIRVFIAVGSGLKQCAIAVLPLFYRLPVFCVCLLHAANGFFIYLFGLFFIVLEYAKQQQQHHQPATSTGSNQAKNTHREKQTDRETNITWAKPFWNKFDCFFAGSSLPSDKKRNKSPKMVSKFVNTHIILLVCLPLIETSATFCIFIVAHLLNPKRSANANEMRLLSFFFVAH